MSSVTMSGADLWTRGSCILVLIVAVLIVAQAADSAVVIAPAVKVGDALTAAAVGQTALPEHLAITQYDGPATCVGCHQTEAQEMFGSLHYQITGPTPNVPNISGNSGKGDTAFNTYCGATVSSDRIACWSCHVAYGKPPQATMTTEQLNNIDCLMCHQDVYKRKPSGPFQAVTFTDYTGVSHTWSFPVTDALGGFDLVMDEANMTITALQAAQTVHRPTRNTCLRCHANAAGSDGAKRGDLSSVSVNPPLTSDVHLSPQGANHTCQDCHLTQNHHMMGRGLDLRANDRPERLTCMLCHTSAPHSDARRNNHAVHIACQTCHIPKYAKDMATEVARDWNRPVWAASLFGGQGGFKPEETRAGTLTPTYAWFDGTSNVYALGQTAVQNAAGQYELGAPIGSVKSPVSQIYPMKEHVSNSALHTATGQLIAHSTYKYFVTGDFNAAVADGMQWAGLSGAWTMVPVHTYQTINHGVEPAANALGCGQCHQQYAAGGTVRMDLQGKLGYALKGAKTTVCTQCHGPKSDTMTFSQVHSKHVDSKRYDCGWCHTFARPERGLRPAPGMAFRPADFDMDGDVDLGDFSWFEACFNGANRATPAANCSNVDLDHDSDVDLGDFGAFQGCFNGPNRAPKC